MPEDDPTTFDSVIARVAKAPEVKVDPFAQGRLVGHTFGKYRIEAQLGAGGMGAVFLAEHVVLGSKAAVKVLRPEYSVQPQVVQRFFDEARAATRISDPGIVTVLDFGWHDSGAAFLVMEYLAGETLAQRIRRTGLLPPAPALALVRQCAVVMAAAHARGIVHRDLKPDNIFVVPDPAVATERIKILDFGIAKLLGDDASHEGTQSGQILGTPGYMSPEQCRGAGLVDHRTDIYALGCVLFAMLCGRPPFVAPTPGDLIAMHITQAPPPPSSLAPGIPPALDALVQNCLAKDVAHRVQTMTELVAAIDDVAVGATLGPLGTALAIGPRPPSATTPAPRATPRPGPPAAAAGTRLASPLAAAIAVTDPSGPPSGVVATTLGSTAGQSFAVPRRRAGGWIGVLVAVAALVGVGLVLANRRADRAARDPAGASAPTTNAAAPIDAAPAPAPADAAPAVIAPSPPDAAMNGRDRPRDPATGKRSHDRASGDDRRVGSGSAAPRDPAVGAGGSGAGSGSAKAVDRGAGSGSAARGSGDYDYR